MGAEKAPSVVYHINETRVGFSSRRNLMFRTFGLCLKISSKGFTQQIIDDFYAKCGVVGSLHPFVPSDPTSDSDLCFL